MRTPIEGTPSGLGLLYQAVTFESVLDHIPLEGWYLPSRGERAIIFVHGIGQNRWNTWERDSTEGALRWAANVLAEVEILHGRVEEATARLTPLLDRPGGM